MKAAISTTPMADRETESKQMLDAYERTAIKTIAMLEDTLRQLSHAESQGWSKQAGLELLRMKHRASYEEIRAQIATLEAMLAE